MSTIAGDYYVMKSGRIITDEDLSNKLSIIVAEHPAQTKPEDKYSAYEWSEMGMAELFGMLYFQECRFCPEHNSWYVYVDGKWEKDLKAAKTHDKIMEFTRLMTQYCAEIDYDDLRNDYLKFVAKMGDRRFRERLLKDATSKLELKAEFFDANPYLVNCQNGTYDLKTRTFREALWSDFITMQTSFCHTVKRDVKCERWETFISEVTQGNKMKARYLQKALGYSLLGKSNEECMFILHGKTTRNGKSTLLNTIQHMLGDYSKVAPVGMICRGDRQKDAEAASPTLAGLKGKRFVTMAESNEYGRLDEEKIKQLTGGEAISARALYQEATTYTPQFTLWLSCNDLPMVTDKSLFASDRLRVIEFNRHFNPDEQDTNLKTEFMTQDAMSGIFMWLVRGYMFYLREGLKMPKELHKVVDAYERDNDVVLAFLEERCERRDGAVTSQKVLYENFKIWAKSNGAFLLSNRKFGGEMERHPDWYTRKYVGSGVAKYEGIAMKEVSE